MRDFQREQDDGLHSVAFTGPRGQHSSFGEYYSLRNQGQLGGSHHCRLSTEEARSNEISMEIYETEVVRQKAGFVPLYSGTCGLFKDEALLEAGSDSDGSLLC